MKAVFCSVETKTEPWVEAAKETYIKKLRAFFPLELQAVKSPSLDREDAILKRRAEAEKILKILKPGDALILFDEKGKSFPDTESFAKALLQNIERSPTRLVFLIGGAFGLDDTLRARAHASWSLGPLTFNHWIAQVVALEQLYRALTILKGIPYHNR